MNVATPCAAADCGWPSRSAKGKATGILRAIPDCDLWELNYAGTWQHGNSEGDRRGDSFCPREGAAIRRSTTNVESDVQLNRIVSAYESHHGRQTSLGEAASRCLPFETVVQSAQRELFRDTCRIIGKAERRRVSDMTETMAANSIPRMRTSMRYASRSASTSLARCEENPANSAKARNLDDVYGTRKMTGIKLMAERVQTHASELNCTLDRTRPRRDGSAIEVQNRNSYDGSEFTLATRRPARLSAPTEAAKRNDIEILGARQRRLRESSGLRMLPGPTFIGSLPAFDLLHSRIHPALKRPTEIDRGDDIASSIMQTKATYELCALRLAGDIGCGETRKYRAGVALSRRKFRDNRVVREGRSRHCANFCRGVKRFTRAFTMPKRADDRENVRQNALGARALGAHGAKLYLL